MESQEVGASAAQEVQLWYEGRVHVNVVTGSTCEEQQVDNILIHHR